MHKTDIGTAMRLYRQNNKLSQTELAKLLDVSQATINTWEAGKGTPTGNKYEMLMAIIKTKNIAEESEINFEEMTIFKKLLQHFTLDEMPLLGKVLSKFHRK